MTQEVNKRVQELFDKVMAKVHATDGDKFECLFEFDAESVPYIKDVQALIEKSYWIYCTSICNHNVLEVSWYVDE